VRRKVIQMATYQGAFDGRMPARTMDVSAVDVLASVVGYVSTVLFVGSIATFLVFAVTFGVREVISWAY
jgi:hypothetical protein